MKKIFLIISLLFFIGTGSNCFAAQIEENATVAVMDFGTHPGAVPIDLDVFNAGQAAGEYVLQRLITSGKFNIMERSLVEDKIKAESLNTTGIIDADTAQKIGKIVGAKYIIYGNVNDVTLSDVGTKVMGLGTGSTVCTVTSHLITRIMNVETGDIVGMSKGEGKSKSGKGSALVIEVGNTKVSQESVHNAIQKAAFNSVDVLIERLYGTKK